MLKTKSIGKRGGQVILEVTIVLVCLALLAIASTKLFANLNLNLLERWRVYRGSRITAVNAPRRLRKELKMPAGLGTRRISDPSAFLYYSPNTRIISPETDGSGGGMGQFVSEDDLFAEPRLILADKLWAEYELISLLLVPYKIRQAHKLAYDMRWVDKSRWDPPNAPKVYMLAAEASVFVAYDESAIVSDESGKLAGVTFGLSNARNCFAKGPEATVPAGKNSYGFMGKLVAAFNLVDDVLREPVIPGPFDPSPDPSKYPDDYEVEPGDAEGLAKLQREHEQNIRGLELLKKVMKSDINAGYVMGVLTEEEKAAAVAERGKPITAAEQAELDNQARGKGFWGDMISRGYYREPEMLLDGLRAVTKCIACGWDPDLPPRLAFAETESCQRLCWYPCWYLDLIRARYWMTAMLENGHPQVKDQADFDAFIKSVPRRIVDYKDYEDDGYNWVRAAAAIDAGRYPKTGVWYRHKKALRALDRVLKFAVDQDFYVALDSAVSRAIRGDLTPAEERELAQEIAEAKADSESDTEPSEFEQYSMSKNPFLTERLADRTIELSGSCAAFSRPCTPEETITLKGVVEKIAEDHKDELEGATEVGDAFDNIISDLTVAVDRLEDEEEEIRNRYTHYVEMAYLSIEALRMAVEVNFVTLPSAAAAAPEVSIRTPLSESGLPCYRMEDGKYYTRTGEECRSRPPEVPIYTQPLSPSS